MAQFLAFSMAICISVAQAAVVEHTFNVGNVTLERLCNSRVITAVNGLMPGPTIRAHEGDTVVVHLLNQSPYNITVHWHGIFQLMSGWADGPSYVTQCPIIPGSNYTYMFNISGQEGTLWWHAHVSFLRATVYGALIIKPRHGTKAYPFPIPYKEVPIILGEWWDANVVDVENEALASGGVPNNSDAFTINGRPGDLHPCSQQHTFTVKVEAGKTYLLRIINAALNHQLFFKAAAHSFTVVAVDASYTTPYTTDILALAPGNTVDALLLADAPPARYYMAAQPYISASPAGGARFDFDNTTATAILQYSDVPLDPPAMPSMPAFNDTRTAQGFYAALTGLVGSDQPVVPLEVDESMFIAYGLGLVPCGPARPKCRGQALAASMNNISFQFPTEMSLLEAHFGGAGGIYTPDFPDRPPVEFNFTSPRVSTDPLVLFAEKGTRVKRVRYNATVEVVLQNTAVLGTENHPLHLHGFNFFVLAQGFGNFDATAAPSIYNLVNPLVRNTVAVPAGGWAVIRFIANNPGVWIMHCHLDVHLTWGLAMAFEVEDGPTPHTSLPPPPPDFPHC